MKKLLTALALMSVSLTGFAQTDYTILRACHPDDVKHYDTKFAFHDAESNGAGQNQSHLLPL